MNLPTHQSGGSGGNLCLIVYAMTHVNQRVIVYAKFPIIQVGGVG